MADAATLSVLLRLRGQAEAERGLKSFRQRMSDVGRNAGELGRSLGLLAAPLVAGAALGIKAASDFESAFAGVRKTVDATKEEFEVLSRAIRQMAQEVPLGVTGLSNIAEAAGQLGIRTENILDFTRVMADLGVTTNLTAEEAATAMARIANVTGLPQDAFEELGSVLVELGNNLATTEAEIIVLGQRFAGAGTIAGLTEPQILAIGAAMSSVGVQAEAGGTAVQKVLLSMTQAVATTGSDLQTFAAVAGQSASEFGESFTRDAGGAFTAFVEGLGRSGTDAFQILEALGLQDQRLIRSFLSLAGAGDLLSRSIDLGTAAWTENTALAREAAIRYETTGARFTIFKNQLQELAIVIGEALIPTLKDVIEAITPAITGFADFAKEHPGLIKLAAAAGLAIAGLAVALITVGAVAPGVAVAVQGLSLAYAALAGVNFANAVSGIASIGGVAAATLGPVVALAAGILVLPAAIKTMTAFLGGEDIARQILDPDAVKEFESGGNILSVTMAQIKGSLKGVTEAITNGIIPSSEASVEAFKDMAEEAGESLRTITQEVEDTISVFDPGLARAIKEATAAARTMSRAFSPDEEAAIAAATAALYDHNAALKELVGTTGELRPPMQDVLQFTISNQAALNNLTVNTRDAALAADELALATTELALAAEAEAAAALSELTTRLVEEIQAAVDAEAATKAFGIAMQTTEAGALLLDDALSLGQITMEEYTAIVAAGVEDINALTEAQKAAAEATRILDENLAAQNPLIPPQVPGGPGFVVGQPPGSRKRATEETLLNLPISRAAAVAFATGTDAWRAFLESIPSGQLSFLKTLASRGLGLSGPEDFLGFARGGVVPGPPGSPQLAVVHGGETVTPAGRSMATVNVIFNAPLFGEDLEERILSTVSEGVRKGGLRELFPRG